MPASRCMVCECHSSLLPCYSGVCSPTQPALALHETCELYASPYHVCNSIVYRITGSSISILSIARSNFPSAMDWKTCPNASTSRPLARLRQAPPQPLLTSCGIRTTFQEAPRPLWWRHPSLSPCSAPTEALWVTI
jgi:hypothetical protein